MAGAFFLLQIDAKAGTARPVLLDWGLAKILEDQRRLAFAKFLFSAYDKFAPHPPGTPVDSGKGAKSDFRPSDRDPTTIHASLPPSHRDRWFGALQGGWQLFDREARNSGKVLVFENQRKFSSHI